MENKALEIILLGTGTSTGIPEVGCGCGLCSSADERDTRRRTSALVITAQGKKILIDAGPDFREQALYIGLDHLDAILITHEHYDHVYGLDDLRTIAWRTEIPIYGQQRVLDAIKQRMHYVFGERPYPGSPRFSLHPIEAGNPFALFDVQITPIEVRHGNLPILGYSFGNELVYITDMKTIEPDYLPYLEQCRLLVINALFYHKPHHSHHSVEDVVGLIGGLATPPQLTLLTHLSHLTPSHTELEKLLPVAIRPGYDFAHITLGKSISIEPYTKPQAPYNYIEGGYISYAKAWELQHKLFDEILSQKSQGLPTQSYLLLCEHNPVFTLGRHGDEANLLLSMDALTEQGFEYFRVERGGDITYHGPGQLTGYPILDLETFGLGLRAYIELLEDTIIELLEQHGIKGGRRDGATGVWLDAKHPQLARKICAIGVKSSRYVTMHGFALNINADLSPFKLINPCGFKEGKVTSMKQELGYELDFTVIKRHFSKLFSRKLRTLQHRQADNS